MLFVLWDESHLWGVLLLRALRAWELPARLISARDAAGGLLAASPPAALLVPGGFASRKSISLGPAGLEAVRDYVRSGGAYLGVCGGAGLGLTVPGGLGLCPWTREPFGSRLQHFASGNVELIAKDGPFTPPGMAGRSPRPLAPVWWPARFRPGEPGVDVVAAYGRPGPGFMMADIPLDLVPPEALEDWEALYGVRLTPSFAENDPCIVAGRFGKGRYVLSHAHLETPDSPEANAWLVHILSELAGTPAPKGPAPAWRIAATGCGRQETGEAGPPEGAGDGLGPARSVEGAYCPGAHAPAGWPDPALTRAMELMRGVVGLGQAHNLLSWREPWLLGWRQGLPGAQLSGVLAMLDEALAITPSPEALTYFEPRRAAFARWMELLAGGLSGYLLAERLAATLARVDPDAVPERGLKEARAALFGPPPGAGGSAGGLCGRVLSVLEECIHLSVKEV
jgi:hypothetical protein